MTDAPSQATPEDPGDDAPASDGADPAPYRNLFVPLIIVPAAIVGAIVLVFTFFGAIAGREASLPENLDRVLHGGANDRKQAAFNMVRQIAENQQAKLDGHASPWPIDDTFLPKLRQAWESSTTSDPKIRLVLASLLADLGDAEGVPSLIALVDTPPGDDADGFVRFNALASLGSIGDPRAEEPAIRLLQHEQDAGLRSVAAIALQRIPGEKSRAALVAALDDEAFEVRANAAIALATRADPAGASVLRGMLDRATYATENQKDSAKFAQPRRVSESRVQAIEALARLHRPEDRAEIQRVADQDDDLAVREAAMKALAGWK